MSKTRNGIIVPSLHPGISPYLNIGGMVEQIPEGAILTEDNTSYLITEDEQFYLQQETEE